MKDFIQSNVKPRIMNTFISNDKDLALVAAMALNGEKYLEEHNGHIDLDDDDAPCAMLMKEIF